MTQQMKADVSLEGSSNVTKKKAKITAGSQNEVRLWSRNVGSLVSSNREVDLPELL